MAKSQIQLDFEASFTPSTTAASLAMVTLAATTIGTWTRIPWWAIGVLGGVAVTINFLAYLANRAKTQPYRVPGTMAISWTLWTTWATLTITTNPYTWGREPWWIAAVAFLALWAITYAILDAADVRDEAHFAEDLDNPTANALSRLEYDRRRRELADTWIDHINTATRIRPTVTGLKEWPQGTGFSLELELPAGSRSDQFDTGACRQMAELARLPMGCTVTPAASTIQGHIVLHVMLTDPTETITDYPNNWTRITINGAVPWVLNPMAEEITVQLREACALILGPPGTGKSTLLDSILAGFARCDDVLVWGIDTAKEGDAFVHWCKDLTPGVNRGVDWVGANKHTAEAMLDAADKIAKTRVRAYRDLMARHNTKLLPISHEIPMIFIVIDEGANILASTRQEDQPLKAKIMNVMETTRAMGIRLILTATDGNVSTIGDSRIRKYSPIRVALTSTDKEGASVSKLFGTVRGLDVRQLRAKGAGVIDAGYGPAQCRTYRSAPSLAKDATAATTTYRPTLDEASHKAIADVYDQRWSHDNTDWWLTGEIPNDATRPRNQIATTDDDDTNEAASGLTLNLKVRNPDGTTTRRTYPHDDGDTEDPTDELFNDIIGNMKVADPRKPTTSLWERADQIRNEWRTAALDILNTRPLTWWSTADVLEALDTRDITVARETLSRELAQLARQGIITTNGKGGAHTRYQGLS